MYGKYILFYKPPKKVGILRACATVHVAFSLLLYSVCPYWAIQITELWTLNFVVVWLMTYTCSHFEWASTAIKYILSMNGPAKSTCTHVQGLEGYVQGSNGAAGGACFTDLHCWQDFAISLSSLGHQKCALPNTFILLVLGWSLWSSFDIYACNTPGIMTRISHRRHSSSTESSCCLERNGFIASDTWSGQPFLVWWSTLLNRGSLCVGCWTAFEVTGKASIWQILKTLASCVYSGLLWKAHFRGFE